MFRVTVHDKNEEHLYNYVDSAVGQRVVEDFNVHARAHRSHLYATGEVVDQRIELTGKGLFEIHQQKIAQRA